MLIQLIVRGEEIYVLEFSARTGGGVKHKLIERICGFDVIKAVVDLTLGEIPHIEIKPPQSKYIVDEFEVCPSSVDEPDTVLQPEKAVVFLSELKAADAASKCGKNALVLGADTLVYAEGHALGKPKNAEDLKRGSC